jgi:hypothetical protein
MFTPYIAGTGNANAAATREAQGLVPMPYTVTAKRVRARRGFFRIAGVVSIAGKHQNGAQVGLYTGVRGKSGITYKLVAKTRTKRGGKYAFNRRLPTKRTYALVERLPTEVQCAATATPAPCSAAIESNAVSRRLTIAARRR